MFKAAILIGAIVLTVGAATKNASAQVVSFEDRSFVFSARTPLGASVASTLADNRLPNSPAILGGKDKDKDKKDPAPYLFVSGEFGGNFTVQGWGSSMSGMQYAIIEIQHNQTLTFNFSGFLGELSKTTGGGTGDSQPIGIRYTIDVLRYPDQAPLPGPGMSRSGNFFTGGLDGTIGPITTAATGGRFYIRIGRQLLVQPGTGPGTYKHPSDPVMTISRF